MKFLRVSLTLLLLALSVCSVRAEGEDRVTAQVRAFYEWYLPLLEAGKSDGLLKHHRKEMARYLTPKLLAKLARIPADTQEGDPFVGSLDSDREWVKNISIRNVKILPKDRASAELHLSGGTAAKVDELILLKLDGGTYKIDGMESLPDFGEMAKAQLRAFYDHYLNVFNHASGNDPLDQETIQEGVTANCLKKAVAGASGTPKFYYLLQSAELDPAWQEHIDVQVVEITPDGSHGTARILFTGEKIPRALVKLTLRHEGNTFKIDEVEKLND